ncbi:MAG: DUF5676 family membrane protein [Longimicrobiales bacterium]|jgi:type IV secretory pathway TrbD component|nr:DUF5676 family membrane protein [Longimicrobiales bacterium]
MQLHPFKLALAAGTTAALLFVVCWLLVAAFPDAATTATEHIEWDMSPAGLILGSLSWFAGTGAAIWLTAATYNRLCRAR